MEKKCKYKHCDKDISDMRPQSLYCSRNHKTYDRILRNRREALLQKWANDEMDKVEFLKRFLQGEYKK